MALRYEEPDKDTIGASNYNFDFEGTVMTNRSWWEVPGTRDLPAEERCEQLDNQVNDLVSYITKLEDFMWKISFELDDDSDVSNMLMNFIGQEGICMHYEIWMARRDQVGPVDTTRLLGKFAGNSFKDAINEWLILPRDFGHRVKLPDQTASVFCTR